MALSDFFYSIVDYSIFLETTYINNYQWYTNRIKNFIDYKPELKKLDKYHQNIVIDEAWCKINLVNYKNNIEPQKQKAMCIIFFDENHQF